MTRLARLSTLTRPLMAAVILGTACLQLASAADLTRAARTPSAPATQVNAPAPTQPAPATREDQPVAQPSPAAPVAPPSTSPVTLVARVVTLTPPAAGTTPEAPARPQSAPVASPEQSATGITVTRRLQAPEAPATNPALPSAAIGAAPLPPAPRATTPVGAPVRIAAVSRPAAEAATSAAATAPAITGPLAVLSPDEAPAAPVLTAPPSAPIATGPPAVPARPNAIPIAPDPNAPAPRPAAPVRAVIAAGVTAAPAETPLTSAPLTSAPAIVAQVTPAPATGPVRIGPADAGPGAAPTLPAPTAASGGPVVSLTPESAASMALTNSIDLKINAANVREAQARVRQAFGLEDFTVTAGATLGRRGPIATVEFSNGEGGTQSIEMGSPDVRTVTLSLSKPLYTSGRLERAQEVAQIGAELQASSGQIVRHALDLSARAAVYNTLRLDQLVGVAQQSAAAVASHLDLSRKLHEAGVVARFEVVQAETELAQAQGRVITARTALENARAGLRRLLTLDQSTSLQLSPGDQTQPPAGDQPTLIAMAQRQRPEVRTQEVAVRLADANVALAAKGKALSVALVGSANLDFASSGLGATDYGWQVALSAQQPILDGHATRDKVTEAKAALDAARLELDKTKEGIALEVAQAVLSLDDANQSLQVARQAQLEAEEQLRIARVRYESGVALGVEVLDAEAALAAARADVVNAQYNVQIATSELRSAVGQ